MNSNKKTKEPFSGIRKSNAFILSVLIVWSLAVVYITKDIGQIIWLGNSFGFKIVALIYIALFYLISLNVIMNVITILFVWITGGKADIRKYIRKDKLPNCPPRVAIFYCTCNDFFKPAIETCISQDYDNYKVFILDDSTDSGSKKSVDDFVAEHTGKVSLIRRVNKQGGKAGNLNHALALLSKEFDYFAIIDADNLIPADFIKKTLGYFSIDSKIGFVQASHKGYAMSMGTLGATLASGVEIIYKNFFPVKNRYGLNAYYGHGTMIRTDVWNKVGEYPLIVAEDLSFSLAARSAGYYGLFAEDVVCQESHPDDYKSTRRRAEKWLKGTLEFITIYFPKYICDKKIHWFEKADIAINAIIFIFPLPFTFLSIMIVRAVLPGLANNANYFSYANTPDRNYLLFAIIGSLFFSIFIFNFFKRDIRKTINFLAYRIYCALSDFIITIINIFSFLFYRKAEFLVTGDKSDTFARDRKMLCSESAPFRLLEIIFAAAFLYYGLRLKSIWLILIGVSTLLNIYITRRNRIDKYTNVLIYLIFALALLGAASLFWRPPY